MIYPAENQHILIYLKSGRVWKGFYFTNGTHPTFASYGAEIPESEIDHWELWERGNHD